MTNDSEVQNQDDPLVRFGVSMPKSVVDALDLWQRDKGFSSRSEAMRAILHRQMVADAWENTDDDVERAGVVVIVFKHGFREVEDNLTEIQHQLHHIAHSSMHVHLDRGHCLETIVLKGRQAEVLSLASQIVSLPGVIFGQFVPATAE
jgi:CopG family transcriptional regulator, nickel-responsive regulator